MASDWFEKMLRRSIFDLKTLTFKARVKHFNYFYALSKIIKAFYYPRRRQQLEFTPNILKSVSFNFFSLAPHT